MPAVRPGRRANRSETTWSRPWASVVLVVLLFGAKLTLEATGEIVICNYEKFHLFDSMYRPRTDNFCVFNDVYLGSDVKGADFLASSLDYKRVAFANSKFPQVPPSLFKNFDDIRELYVRRCSLESLKITRLLEKVYAGSNRISAVQLDGNASNSLRELYLDGNRLQGLANLTNLPALEVLVLENNPLLGDIDFAQFGRMERLWKLDLERVGMARIANGLQRPLAQLRRLDLSNNALTYVHVRMFRTFPKLEHLWLHGNRLYYMEADQVRTLMPAIRSIVIDDNPWGCGHLAALGKELRDRGIVVRHGECRKDRAVHRVCCTDETDVMDTRYLIELDIRREGRFQQDVRELRADNDLLRRELERVHLQLAELVTNFTRSTPDPSDRPEQLVATVEEQASGEEQQDGSIPASDEEYDEGAE
uniref:Uncharacterized protein n=1 Tax=Anopheles farauti TaxID=69004 RepID=A0A182QJM1_9DIPT